MVVSPSNALNRHPAGSIALDDSRLIDTWDRAARLARPWRELALLESASGIAVDDLARLTIGERDRLLLALRIGTFGNRLECETRCPACDTRLELSFDATELLTPATYLPSHLTRNLKFLYGSKRWAFTLNCAMRVVLFAVWE